MKLTKRNSTKGFSMVELIVVIAVLVVLTAVLVPSLLKYMENSRIESDNSSMNEVAHSIKLAMSDVDVFDEVRAQAVENNYLTFSDSNSIYGGATTDEEFWAPDGAGYAMTITFMQNESGDIVLADGVVNNVPALGGTTGDGRYINPAKQCKLSDMDKLYAKIKSTFGTTVSGQSATYSNSTYTIFVELEPVGEILRPNIYGEWNGTNLTPDCPQATPTGEKPSTTPPVNDNNGTQQTQPTQPTTPSPSQPNNGGSGGTTTPTQPSAPEEEVARIPAGGVYYVGVTTTQTGDYTGYSAKYVEGDPFPTAQQGDIYVYGDYEYRYNMNITSFETLEWARTPHIKGWGARVLNTSKSSYSPIVSTIHKTSVTSMNGTYACCSNLVGAPVIPDSIEYMYAAFYQCKKLVTAPVLPAQLKTLTMTFQECTNLQTAPAVPSTVTNLTYAFRDCTSLTGIVEINSNTENRTAVMQRVNFVKQNITLTGTSLYLDEIGQTGLNYCANCNGTCHEN